MPKVDTVYHLNRASEELHLGLTTPCASAAKAHLGLSALHFRRAREGRSKVGSENLSAEAAAAQTRSPESQIDQTAAS